MTSVFKVDSLPLAWIAAGRSPDPRDKLRLGRSGGKIMPKTYTRLTHPLVRDGGSLRRASWEEAIDRAASGFEASLRQYGGSSFGLFSCSKATNETNYMAQKFARVVMGSNNIDSCNRT
jgi:predicted molibdopterin-dependent oxidoreductase YjgC